MKTKKISLYPIFGVLAFLTFSCDIPYTLNINQAPDKLIVEGRLLFDTLGTPNQQFVRLTKTIGFYDKGQFPVVSGAKIKIEDSDRVYDFFESQTRGLYLPTNPIVGKEGMKYLLTVEAEGKTYTALETYSPLNSTLDSLAWELDLDYIRLLEADNTIKDKSRVYNLTIFARVFKNPNPQDRNSYKFEFFQNDTLLTLKGTNAFVGDDEFINADINGVKGPERYRLGDTARFDIISISRKVFTYYNSLNAALNNDGGMWSSIPANPETNLTGGALGIFIVGERRSRRIVIGE